jgi:hypothetical protein
MVNPETSGGARPLWESAIVGFFQSIARGNIERDQIAKEMGVLSTMLIQTGRLNDYGELQGHFRQYNSFIQLLAEPFVANDKSQPGLKCNDVVTGESRTHCLKVVVSGLNGREMRRELQALNMSNEVNEATLAHNTGMLVVQA